MAEFVVPVAWLPHDSLVPVSIYDSLSERFPPRNVMFMLCSGAARLYLVGKMRTP
jgi:hypothetical protein